MTPLPLPPLPLPPPLRPLFLFHCPVVAVVATLFGCVFLLSFAEGWEGGRGGGGVERTTPSHVSHHFSNDGQGRCASKRVQRADPTGKRTDGGQLGWRKEGEGAFNERKEEPLPPPSQQRRNRFGFPTPLYPISAPPPPVRPLFLQGQTLSLVHNTCTHTLLSVRSPLSFLRFSIVS